MKAIEDTDVGSSEYHFVCAEYCRLMAEKEENQDEKQGWIERGELHQLMGEIFGNKKKDK